MLSNSEFQPLINSENSAHEINQTNIHKVAYQETKLLITSFSNPEASFGNQRPEKNAIETLQEDFCDAMIREF